MACQTQERLIKSRNPDQSAPRDSTSWAKTELKSVERNSRGFLTRSEIFQEVKNQDGTELKLCLE